MQREEDQVYAGGVKWSKLGEGCTRSWWVKVVIWEGEDSEISFDANEDDDDDDNDNNNNNNNNNNVARMEEGRTAFKILTGKTTESRPLGRPRLWWEDYIRMEFK